MRKFIIFFLVGILSVGGVLLYAQFKRDDVTVVDWTKTPTYSPRGSVKGIKNTKAPSSVQANSVKIIIDKNPVQIYWPQKITIQANPGTEVRVVTTYPNGSLNNNGTKTGYADKKGQFIIRWNISGSKNLIGKASVDVSAGSLETYSEARASFDIVKSLKGLEQQPSVQTNSPTGPHITPLLSAENQS